MSTRRVHSSAKADAQALSQARSRSYVVSPSFSLGYTRDVVRCSRAVTRPTTRLKPRNILNGLVPTKNISGTCCTSKPQPNNNNKQTNERGVKSIVFRFLADPRRVSFISASARPTAQCHFRELCPSDFFFFLWNWNARRYLAYIFITLVVPHWRHRTRIVWRERER